MSTVAPKNPPTNDSNPTNKESGSPSGSRTGSCPYCGTSLRQCPAKAKCSVCGMTITEDHFPHIIRVDPEGGTVHFCSLACMDNYEYIEEGDGDG